MFFLFVAVFLCLLFNCLPFLVNKDEHCCLFYQQLYVATMPMMLDEIKILTVKQLTQFSLISLASEPCRFVNAGGPCLIEMWGPGPYFSPSLSGVGGQISSVTSEGQLLCPATRVHAKRYNSVNFSASKADCGSL